MGVHLSKGRLALVLLLLTISSASVLAVFLPRLLSPVNTSSGGFVFVAAGDHGATSYSDTSLGDIPGTGAVFYLALGDLSYDNVTPESAWCDYVTTRVGATFPFELVGGNHEEDSRVDGFIDNFAGCLPDRAGSTGQYAKEYYFDYPTAGPLVRVIGLAAALTIDGVAYNYVAGNSHYQWLSGVIDDARSKGIQWVVVAMHKVCITMGNKPCEIGIDLMNLLINKRVDLVLQGHDHDYQRSKQLTCATPGIFQPSCVADDGSDNAYTKGAGTVFAIAGIFGGGAFTPVNASDPESGYFAKAMGGLTPGGGRGFVKYIVNADRIDAQLIITTQQVSGTLFSDSFAIVSGSSATPQSSFSWSPNIPNLGQTVTFSATTVGGTAPYSYTWNFGDGGTSSGSTVTHAYAQAGVFSVNLTVTDAVGSRASVLNSITITDSGMNSPVVTNRQYWGTFYYPWYGNSPWRHWNDRGHSAPTTWASMYLPDDGSGLYNPSAELYNSKATVTINRHLTWMDDARLDFALVSWWGQNSYEDQALSTMLSEASNNSTLRLKLAVYYEEEAGSDPTASQIVSDLTYIYDTKANSNAYFKISDGTRNYPVVFVYAGPTDASDYANRWSQARDQMYAAGKPVFIVLKVFVGFGSYATSVDGWHQYAPSKGYELQNGYSAFASPGYWEYPELAIARGRADPYSPLLARDIDTFKTSIDTLTGLTLPQAKFLLVETFNEWHEGSQIEPGMLINHVETGFTQATPSYGFSYIKILRDRGQVNRAPVLTVPGAQIVSTGAPLTFDVSAIDSDTLANNITLTISSLPSGAIFPTRTAIGSVKNTFSWTPSSGQVGNYTIAFTATDNGAPPLSDTRTVTITVLAPGSSPPTLDPIGPKTVNEELTLAFTATATDPDVGQSLTFYLGPGGSLGVSITPAGVFSWTPSEEEGPNSYMVTVVVADNGSPAAYDSETITITVREVNRAPVLAVPSNQTVDPGALLSLKISASDPDLPANLLSLSASGLPAGATFDAATGTFSWTPSSTQGPGDYVLTFTANDDGNPVLSDSKTVAVRVSPPPPQTCTTCPLIPVEWLPTFEWLAAGGIIGLSITVALVRRSHRRKREPFH